MKQIYEMHAEICKTLANPKRLEIINTLRDKEMPVSELLAKIKLRKANLSQHLAIMRVKGIVKTRRAGTSIYYKLANAKVIKACDIMRQVLIEQLSESNNAIGKLERMKQS